jgi:hypothetical protein
VPSAGFVKLVEGQQAIARYLRDEARRLDGHFLAGVTRREEWERQRPALHEQYLDMLGQTVEGGRVADVVDVLQTMCAPPPPPPPRPTPAPAPTASVKLVGRGQAGIVAAYAALLVPAPFVVEGVVVAPPRTHRDGPIFLNVLRVTDIPEALGLLAPRPLTIRTGTPAAFETTAQIYRAAGGSATIVFEAPAAHRPIGVQECADER